MHILRRVASSVAVLLLAAGSAHAQTVPDPAHLRGDSAQTRKRLIDARQKVLSGKHVEAIDELQRVLDEAGDDLVSADGKQYRPARFIVHQILLTLPPDALKAYQDRVEEPARKLLDAGKRDRDPRPLWQLVDRYFTSRPASEGLLMLGDLLFERGQFRTAELLWRRLLPPEAVGTWPNLLAEVADITHPIPTADPAAVRARVTLAVIFQGELDEARQELFRLTALHPGASGSLAGKHRPYIETLLQLLNDPPRVSQDENRDWPTFGGGPSRTGRITGRMPYHWPARPTWHKDLFANTGTTNPARPFAHPVIVENKVYLTDGEKVRAFDLKSGSPSGDLFPARIVDPKQTPDPAYSLTAGEGRLFVRLGSPLIRSPQKEETSGLGCFALARASGTAQIAWPLSPRVLSTQGGIWEGPPLVVRGRMWAAVARFDGARVVHSIACFDPLDPDRAPDRPAWTMEVCDGALPPSPATQNPREGRPRHELLTLAGRNVVFCSNSGAIVAVDATSGRRAWAFKYSRAARRIGDAARSPDPAPAVAFGGRVFVAPADADHVYAFDEETGNLLWESGMAEGAQLLGVARNRLIVTTEGTSRGIRGLSIANGSHRSDEGGWAQLTAGVATFGRGLVSDDAIVWPTTAGLWFLDPDTGRPLAQLRSNQPPPRDGLFGNLTYADGVLVVVTPTEVWGYVADGAPAPENPERKRFTEIIGAAERDLGDGKFTEGRADLFRVLTSDLPAGQRAWAAARLLLLSPSIAPDVRAALTPELGAEWLHFPDGSLRTLGQLVAERSGERKLSTSEPSRPSTPGDRTNTDSPTLGVKSRVEHSLRLPPAACPLIPLSGGPLRPRNLYTNAASTLLTIPLDGSAIVERTPIGTITHACEFADGCVAVGPNLVAIYGHGREPEWVFRVPELHPLPGRRGQIAITIGDPAEPAVLSSAILAGPWLFARLGEHHLIALDLQTRQVAWILGSHGRSGYERLAFPTTPRFEPRFFVNAQVLIAQLSDGRRWTIQTKTGHVLDASGFEFDGPVPAGYGEETARVPWVHPPVEIEPGRLAIADGTGLVRAIELDTGKATTLYSAEGPSSLSGEPPQVRAWNGNVLVSVRRNHGVELDLAEAEGRTGSWQAPTFFDTSRIDITCCDADPLRIYVPAGDRLIAIRLKDGSNAWTVELPDSHRAGGWVVRAGKKAIVVYPEFALPTEPAADVAARAVRSFTDWPRGRQLPVFAFRMYDAWVARTVPVLLFDPQTGKELARFDLSARGPIVSAWFEGDLAVVMTGDRVVWLK